MSWAEIKKAVNTNLDEPLNYNQYISDIKSFGDRSYVLRPGNRALMLDLLSNSLTVFGDDTIHETIYNTLTDNEVDYWMRRHRKLGQALNLFYQTNVFSAGNIDGVLSGLSTQAINTLESKLSQGISRYIDSILSFDTGVGKWFNDTYSLNSPDLAACESVEDIIASSNGFQAVLSSEGAINIIFFIDTIINMIIENESALNVAFTNEQFMTCLLIDSNVNKMTDVAKSNAALSVIFTSKMAMQKIESNSKACGILNNSPLAITKPVPFGNKNNYITHLNQSAYLIGAKQTFAGGPSYHLYFRFTAVNNGSIGANLTESLGKFWFVNKFMSSIQSTMDYDTSYQGEIKYIPIN